jgi:hypothetical protein
MRTVDLARFDLSHLPCGEDQEYEFKSSRTPETKLPEKLCQAVSGFANSGGGCFVAGVDRKGDADGGLPLRRGRQDLGDWVDQIVGKVEPTPAYERKLLTEACGRGTIASGNCVLVVAIHESHFGPHMAPDHMYYIRAGAHTVPARHFIVDAIWAKRHFGKPRLTHLLRLKPTHTDIVQLGILALTDAPAIDVRIDLTGSLGTLSGSENVFPLQIPVIDRENPFYIDLTNLREAWEKKPQLSLQVEYRSLADEHYSYNATVDVPRSIPPVVFSDPVAEQLSRIREALVSIEKKLPTPAPNGADPIQLAGW